jgi:hypothetical protein
METSMKVGTSGNHLALAHSLFRLTLPCAGKPAAIPRGVRLRSDCSSSDDNQAYS